MKKKCVLSMEKRNILLKDIVGTLKVLTADDVERHTHFTESNLNVFAQAINHSELVGTLGFHMNYLSFHLFGCIVNEFGLEDVKAEMETYVSDLQNFREKTPVTLFHSFQPRMPKNIEPPPNFRKMILVFDSDYMMLDNVEQFRIEYSHYHKLQQFTMVLAKVDLNPISVTWFIPESIVEKLLKGIPRNILRKYLVSKLHITGACVYRLRTSQKVGVTCMF